MKSRTKFLQDSDGNASVTRLISLILVCKAVLFSGYMIYTNIAIVEVCAYLTTSVGLAATFKLYQNDQERKSKKGI